MAGKFHGPSHRCRSTPTADADADADSDTNDQRNRDDKCRYVAKGGIGRDAFPSKNPGLKNLLQKHSPNSKVPRVGKWNGNSWANLDQLIADALSGGVVGRIRTDGTSDCEAYMTSLVPVPGLDMELPGGVGTNGSSRTTDAYIVFFNLDGSSRSA